MVDNIDYKTASPLVQALISRDLCRIKDLIRSNSILLNKVDPSFRISPLMILLAKEYPLYLLDHEDFNYDHVDRLGRNILYYCQNEKQLLFCLKKIKKKFLIETDITSHIKLNKVLIDILKHKNIYTDDSFNLISDELERKEDIVEFLKEGNLYNRSLIHKILKKSIKDDVFHFNLIIYLEILKKHKISKDEYRRIIEAYSHYNLYDKKEDFDYFFRLDKLLSLISQKYKISKIMIQLFNSRKDDQFISNLKKVLIYIDRINIDFIPNNKSNINKILNCLNHCINKSNCELQYKVDLRLRNYSLSNKLQKIKNKQFNDKYEFDVATNSYELMNWGADLYNCLYERRDIYDQRDKIIICLRNKKNKEVRYAIEIMNGMISEFKGNRNRQLNPENSSDLSLLRNVHSFLYNNNIIKYDYEKNIIVKKREEVALKILNYFKYGTFSILYILAVFFIVPFLIVLLPLLFTVLFLYSTINLNEY